MKTTILLCLFLVTNCLVSFAQEHGKVGLRVATGFSTLQDDLYKFTPIPAYSLGLILMEKNVPFSVRGELILDTKGGYLGLISEKLTIYCISLCVLSQFKFKPQYKHAITSGIYLSDITNPQVSHKLSAYPVGSSFSHFDMGINVGYKYQILSIKTLALQLDTRFSYGLVNINKQTFGDSKWTRNVVAQVGLNFIIGK